jgi:hypothetical protein
MTKSDDHDSTQPEKVYAGANPKVASKRLT